MGTVLSNQKKELNVAVDSKVFTFSNGLVKQIFLILFFFRDLVKFNLVFNITSIKTDLLHHGVSVFIGAVPSRHNLSHRIFD